MPSLEPSMCTTVGSEKCSRVKAQGQDFKNINYKYVQGCKEDRNKSLSKGYENIKRMDEIMKAVQDMKIEIKSLKETQIMRLI